MSNVIQGSEAWFEQRMGRATASRIDSLAVQASRLRKLSESSSEIAPPFGICPYNDTSHCKERRI